MLFKHRKNCKMNSVLKCHPCFSDPFPVLRAVKGYNYGIKNYSNHVIDVESGSCGMT